MVIVHVDAPTHTHITRTIFPFIYSTVENMLSRPYLKASFWANTNTISQRVVYIKEKKCYKINFFGANMYYYQNNKKPKEMKLEVVICQMCCRTKKKSLNIGIFNDCTNISISMMITTYFLCFISGMCLIFCFGIFSHQHSTWPT